MADTGVQKNIRMDAAARREQILNTACGLFYEYGYDGVTTKQLAEALGCSEGLIFKYFPSKDAIYQALLQEWEDSMTEPVVFERVEDSPIRTLEKIYTDMVIRRAWQKSPKTRPHLEAAILTRTSMSKEHFRILGESPDVVFCSIMPLVREGQDKGEIRQGDPVAISVMFANMVLGMIQSNRNYPGRYPKIPFEVVRSVLFDSK